MLRTFLIELLKSLEAEIPPPTNCHHAITFAKYGNDEIGWEDRLALQVNTEGKFYCFFLDDDDISDPLSIEKIQNISTYIKDSIAAERVKAIMQPGVACGQYTT